MLVAVISAIWSIFIFFIMYLAEGDDYDGISKDIMSKASIYTLLSLSGECMIFLFIFIYSKKYHNELVPYAFLNNLYFQSISKTKFVMVCTSCAVAGYWYFD